MYSSIFGPHGLYLALYSTSECRTLYSAFQVYIQRYIQTPNVEHYIRSSRSIFSTIFKRRMYSSVFSSPGLFSAVYSTSECRALYSALQIYIHCYIQTPNVELFIRLSRSIFSTIFKLRIRALHSGLKVYIQHYIQHLTVELYIRPSRCIFSAIFKLRM